MYFFLQYSKCLFDTHHLLFFLNSGTSLLLGASGLTKTTFPSFFCSSGWPIRYKQRSWVRFPGRLKMGWLRCETPPLFLQLPFLSTSCLELRCDGWSFKDHFEHEANIDAWKTHAESGETKRQKASGFLMVMQQPHQSLPALLWTCLHDRKNKSVLMEIPDILASC